MVNAVEHNIALSEETGAARNVVEAILKARKTLKIYPGTNPVYMENLQNAFDKLKDFFACRDKLTFRFGRNDIYYNSESVYRNPQKEENLALLFFKDGIREITISRDVSCDEIEDFLKIIAADFNKGTVEDDVVTLLWQRGFTNIKYIAEDIILTEGEDNESDTLTDFKQRPSEPYDLKRAYDGPLEEDEVLLSIPIIPPTPDDDKYLLDMLEKDSEEKLTKYFNMLFEIYHDVERVVEYEDIVYFFMKSIEHSINKREFRLMADVLVRLKRIIGNEDTDPEMRKSAIKVLLFVSGKKMISIIGHVLDREEVIEKEVFLNYIYLLDQNAVSPLIALLGDLQSIYARRMIMDALTRLIFKDASKYKMGAEDISRLIKELDHSDWYVVARIIDVLSGSGDVKLTAYIKTILKHEDPRVRKEAVNSIGKWGKDNVLSMIRECLDDKDFKVRNASLSAIGDIATDAAKKTIMEKISGPSFNEKGLDEKKEYFGTLARWNDKSVYDFCVRTIMKKSFWNRSIQYETKACAVYCLGLIGNKDALPVLNKCKTSGNRLFCEFTDQAIRRIESDRQ